MALSRYNLRNFLLENFAQGGVFENEYRFTLVADPVVDQSGNRDLDLNSLPGAVFGNVFIPRDGAGSLDPMIFNGTHEAVNITGNSMSTAGWATANVPQFGICGAVRLSAGSDRTIIHMQYQNAGTQDAYFVIGSDTAYWFDAVVNLGYNTAEAVNTDLYFFILNNPVTLAGVSQSSVLCVGQKVNVGGEDKFQIAYATGSQSILGTDVHIKGISTDNGIGNPGALLNGGLDDVFVFRTTEVITQTDVIKAVNLAMFGTFGDVLMIMDNVGSSLASTLNAGATQMTIQAADAYKFGFPYNASIGTRKQRLTIDDGQGNVEIVYATGRVGNVLDIERGKEFTNDITHQSGALVEVRMTAQALYSAARPANNIDDIIFGIPTDSITALGPLVSFPRRPTLDSNSVAIGSQLSGGSGESINIGFNNNWTGSDNFVIGSNISINQNFSIAVGPSVVDTVGGGGSNNILLGNGANVGSGSDNVVLGLNARVVATHSRCVSIGPDADSGGSDGVAIGYNTTSDVGGVAIGAEQSAEANMTSMPPSIIAQDGLFGANVFRGQTGGLVMVVQGTLGVAQASLGTQTINIPTGSVFYPVSGGLLVVSSNGTAGGPTQQLTLGLGSDLGDNSLLADTLITDDLSINNRARVDFNNLLTEEGIVSLKWRYSMSGSPGSVNDLQVRFYMVGFLVKHA